MAAATTVDADSTLVPPRRAVSRIVIPIVGVDAGVPGHIGVDLLLGDGAIAPCLDPDEPFLGACAIAGSYYKVVHWPADGYVPTNVITIDNADNGLTTDWADKTSAVHLEVYPYGNAQHDNYDPWTQSVGGSHLWVRDFPESGDGQATAPVVGVVPTPKLGDGVAFRVDGQTVSNSPLTDGRLRIDLFEITAPNGAALQGNTGTYAVGAFATSTSRDGRWTGGVLWPGTYSMYVFDYATGRTVNAFVNLAPGQVPTLDLDAVCFGLDPCQYVAGRPPPATGTFHPVAASRILDTRRAFGIAGPLRPGDGRSSDPAFSVRQIDARDHELKVTGVGGVPTTGVSAVLLQLTGAEPDTSGAYVSVYPKPPRIDLWNDRSGFPAAEPAFSNVNVPEGEAVANLVYVPVGAGGKIRLHSRPGTIQAIADVVGWFDDGDASGATIEAVAPARILDTRLGTGGDQHPFGAGETRALAVRGAGGVPGSATAVVVNLTADRATADSYVTAWPSGVARPDASALNPRPGAARSGLATVPIGADGSISLYNDTGRVDLIADVVGYVTATSATVTANPSTAIDPTRLLDTRVTLRPLAPGESRVIPITGVPSSAHAVWLNVTGTNATQPGYLTVWPSGTARPDASNLNVAPGRSVANLVLVPLGSDGAVQVFNASGTTDLLIDLAGYLG